MDTNACLNVWLFWCGLAELRANAGHWFWSSVSQGSSQFTLVVEELCSWSSRAVWCCALVVIKEL